jgi:hypothetical protein
MSSKRKLIVLSVVALAALGLSIPAILGRLFVYPTPEQESSFLRSYTPESVVEQFRLQRSGSRWSNLASAAVGRTFASHRHLFDGQFAIDAKNWMPLMSSMSENLSTQLSLRGAQILNQSGDARDGFHCDYKVGKNLGWAVISPLRIVNVQQGSADKLQVALDVSIEEKWFRQEPGLIDLRISSSSY